MLSPLSADWLQTLPDLALALFSGLVAIRIVLVLIVPAGIDSRLYRLLRYITDVVVIPVRFVTPRIAPLFVVLVFALVWLFLARFLAVAITADTDLTPSLSLRGGPDTEKAAIVIRSDGTRRPPAGRRPS